MSRKNKKYVKKIEKPKVTRIGSTKWRGETFYVYDIYLNKRFETEDIKKLMQFVCKGYEYQAPESIRRFLNKHVDKKCPYKNFLIKTSNIIKKYP